MTAAIKLERAAFRTSRLLDFCSRKELIAQTGHQPEVWPLVICKELIDNALDACEDSGEAPDITVAVDSGGITVEDNGPGIPSEVVDGVLDFSVRVSTREAYVSPTRGAQGNALKTVVAMPFVLDGEQGRVDVEARGVRHEIAMKVDRIRQQPVLDRITVPVTETAGTKIVVRWPDSPSSLLAGAKARFLQNAMDYTFLNPHLTLALNWFGEPMRTESTAPGWKKWLPSDPTCPHWYDQERFERLVAAYIAFDQDAGRKRTVRELVAEFRGLTATAKQKAVLHDCGLLRAALTDLGRDGVLQSAMIRKLLTAMQQHGKEVKPAALGLIGKEHLQQRFEELGCEMESFAYKKILDTTDGIPWILETAFGWCPELANRRLVSGVNWSPGIINLFRELGKFGSSLDSILEQQRAGKEEPVVLVLHMACPRVEYTDRGKSAVVVSN